MLCALVLHKQRHSTSLTFFAAGWPTTHSSKAATISLGVGMSLMPQFMLADVPLKFWPPYWVWPVMTLCVYSWPELAATKGRIAAQQDTIQSRQTHSLSEACSAGHQLLLLLPTSRGAGAKTYLISNTFSCLGLCINKLNYLCRSWYAP